MSYGYSLAINDFVAENNLECLTAIREAEPDIGESMSIVNDLIEFSPDDNYGKWDNCEETVAEIIAARIKPGTTCCMHWTGEDDQQGGTLIGRDCLYSIRYIPTVSINGREMTLEEARKILSLEPEPPSYRTSWRYHEHGEHSFFWLDEWWASVASADTVLGYQQWVEHNLTTSLYDEDLTNVDAIEVASCTECDGVIEVMDESEQRADFWSVYRHIPGLGVECLCDFNTKSHALEFARALAARTGIPVYGNLCSVS